MYYLEREFKVPVGHRLSKHKGLCKNIHGHTIKIVVTLMSYRLNNNDMVIDFSDLKKMVEELFLKNFDHCLLLNSEDIIESNHCKKNNLKYICFDQLDPTAETISKYIYDIIDAYIRKFYGNHMLCCRRVVVWENESSSCVYMDHKKIKEYMKLEKSVNRSNEYQDKNEKETSVDEFVTDESGLFLKYFVLKPGGDNVYAEASRKAMLEYAKHIDSTDKKFSNDLRKMVAMYTPLVKVDKTIQIGDIHKKNWELIEKNNIKVGDIFVMKNSEYTETLMHIHSLYGWLTTDTDRQKLPQSVEEALQLYDHCPMIGELSC